MLRADLVNWFSQTLSCPESVLLLCGWIGALSWCVVYYYKRISRVYLKKWYDLSTKGPNEDMDWCQIRTIMNKDALQEMPFMERLRFPPNYLLRDAFSILILGLVFYSSLMLLPDFTNIGKEFGVAVGIVTVFVSVAAIFYNVRLKSRAHNRQEWINSLRTEIGVLIARRPPQGGADQTGTMNNTDIQKHFAMLELYLNPSEPVHRAFLTLLRFMYGLIDREDDSDIREALGIELSQRSGQAQNAELGEEHWRDWRIKAVRLANVLLKREWEQVKHVK